VITVRNLVKGGVARSYIETHFQSELTDTNDQGEPLGSSSFILN